MVQKDEDYKLVTFGEPSIYIDCNRHNLYHYKWGIKPPSADQIN